MQKGDQVVEKQKIASLQRHFQLKEKDEKDMENQLKLFIIYRMGLGGIISLFSLLEAIFTNTNYIITSQWSTHDKISFLFTDGLSC